MINSIIFDLDGVLLDSREIHYEALNLALSEVDSRYLITLSEQETIYEGLTTRDKLEILTKLKGLSKYKYEQIWMSKQNYSTKLFESLVEDTELVLLFKHVRAAGIKIGVASNSIRSTLDLCLKRLGVYDLIDWSFSNEDVITPKPSPEIYVKCMAALGSPPSETLIFEDSNIGRQAAIRSGAHLVEVNSRLDLTVDRINGAIYEHSI